MGVFDYGKVGGVVRREDVSLNCWPTAVACRGGHVHDSDIAHAGLCQYVGAYVAGAP